MLYHNIIHNNITYCDILWHGLRDLFFWAAVALLLQCLFSIGFRARSAPFSFRVTEFSGKDIFSTCASVSLYCLHSLSKYNILNVLLRHSSSFAACDLWSSDLLQQRERRDVVVLHGHVRRRAAVVVLECNIAYNTIGIQSYNVL